jgi:DNA replication protein DnaC
VSEAPQILLAHHLKKLKLPSFLREYDKQARLCASEGTDHVRYLLRLAELELIDRERRMVERRIKAARFPTVKSLDSFDFPAIPALNKALVLELARGDYIERCENVIALGPSGTGKTHIALGLGLAACQKGLAVGFTTAAALVHELIEARDDKQLLRLQKRLAKLKLLIIDELGFVPLSKTGAERRMDRGLRIRAPHRRAARPPHTSRPYPRDERRELPSQTKPIQEKQHSCLSRIRLTPRAHWPLPRAAPRQLT